MRTTEEFQPIPESLIREYQPQESWLRHDSTIHGIGHLTRVFILQELISNQLVRDGEILNQQALRWAAISHDVGRVDDGLDPQHGRRSAQWMHENLREAMSPETLDIATYIVRWHVPNDWEAPKMTLELQILKDADALDRVRLDDLDPAFLRTNPSQELIDIAQQLCDLSLTENIPKETFDSVLTAARKLNLVTHQ